MKKIGLLFGCFNPIHNEHLNLAKKSLKVVDEIIIVPCYSNINFKDSKIIDAKYRLEMINLAIKNEDKITVSDIEIKQKRQLFTFETLELLREKNNNDYYLIIGSDNLKTFDTWREYEEILKNHRVIVSCREDSDNIIDIVNQNLNLRKYKEQFMELRYKKKHSISSTLIRNKIANKEKVEEYLSKEIINYISDNNLFRNEGVL